MFYVALAAYCALMLFGLFLTVLLTTVTVIYLFSLLPPCIQRYLDVKLF